MEDYKNMSNLELKLYVEKLSNKFEKTKNEILKLCDELEQIQFKYNNVNLELELRKKLY